MKLVKNLLKILTSTTIIITSPSTANNYLDNVTEKLIHKNCANKQTRECLQPYADSEIDWNLSKSCRAFLRTIIYGDDREIYLKIKPCLDK